jgi:hypothetical protein
MSGGLIIVGFTVIVVPLIVTLALSSIYLLVMVLDPVVSISIVNDVPKLSCTLTLVALIW